MQIKTISEQIMQQLFNLTSAKENTERIHNFPISGFWYFCRYCCSCKGKECDPLQRKSFANRNCFLCVGICSLLRFYYPSICKRAFLQNCMLQFSNKILLTQNFLYRSHRDIHIYIHLSIRVSISFDYVLVVYASWSGIITMA